MSLTAPDDTNGAAHAAVHAAEHEPGLDEAYPRLLYRLLKLTNLVGRPFFTHFAARYDLTMNDARVLLSLASVRQAAAHELCDMTGMHPMNASRSVAALKRQGRITDWADPDNRRRKLLTPTEEGWALYLKLAPHVKVLSEFVFATLSEREVEFLSSLIAVLSERLESVDLNSPELIDVEAMARDADEMVPVPPPLRRRRKSTTN